MAQVLLLPAVVILARCMAALQLGSQLFHLLQQPALDVMPHRHLVQGRSTA